MPDRHGPACSRCRGASYRGRPAPAPSAAAANEVAIEKKTTVPPVAPSRGSRRCSQPGTSTHRRSRQPVRPRLRDRLGQADRVAGRPPRTTSRPGRPRAVAASVSVGTTPTGDPRRRGAHPPGTATRFCRPRRARATVAVPRSATSRPRRRRRAGAPQTSMTMSASSRVEVVRQDGGDRPAEEDRVAAAGHLFTERRPTAQPVGDAQRGQRQRHEGGHPVPHRAARAGVCGRPRRRCRRACRPTR